MEHELKHPYPSVCAGETVTCGGNQRLLTSPVLRRCGCGAVAMTDFLCYVSRYHGYPLPEEAKADPIPLPDYDRLLRRLQGRYLPIVPPLGTSGLALAAGLELYFRVHRIPLHALWGVPMGSFWDRMGQLLDRDFPVIFAIGQSVPFIWQLYKLPLYRKAGNVYMPVSHVSAHFITATGLDSSWVRVSSWGKEYFIHRREYMVYAKTHSLTLASNLLWLP